MRNLEEQNLEEPLFFRVPWQVNSKCTKLNPRKVRLDPSWRRSVISASRSSPSPGLAEGCAALGLWLCQPARDIAFYHLVLKWGLLSGKPSPVSKAMLEEVWLLSCLNTTTSKLQSSLLVAICSWHGGWACAIQPRFASEIPVWGGMQPSWLLYLSKKLAGIPLATGSSIRWHGDERNNVSTGQVKWLNNSKKSLLRCLQPLLSSFLFRCWCGDCVQSSMANVGIL